MFLTCVRACVWHFPDMNIKQRPCVCNLKPAIYYGSCEGNGRGQEGVGLGYSLHAPLATVGMPEEICESELIWASKTSDRLSHQQQSKFERNEPL